MLTRKLLILWVLYFVQGMPFGFQVTALPVYLRSEGVSLTGIGLATVLALPWVLKLAWGPPVDRFGSRRLGRRRSWILPLQAALAASCVAAAYVPAEGGVRLLLLAVLFMNLFAATMDVAVDGLAVDLLEPGELGYGNIAQVVGYKLGMLTGGGLLVWASESIGRQGLFFAMAGLTLLALAVTAGYRERPPEGARATAAPTSMRAVLLALGQAVRLPGTAWLFVFIATYKLGETLADTMFRPFLVDADYDAGDIGLWLGTWGVAFSIAGSLLGGILASRMDLLGAVALTAALRALAVGGEWWLSLVEPTLPRMAAVVSAEQLFGGALTTALFAYMMSRVDRRIGATHFTLLATVEVLGKLAASWASGFITDATSYPTLFGLATVLAVAFLALLVPLRRSVEGQSLVI
jgi:MFS family permease